MEINDTILDEHIDKIVSIVKSINTGRITVLVGANGTGKSLIRKQINVRLMKEIGSNTGVVRHVSQQLRTELRSDMGALACIAMDSETDPTSVASFNLLETVMNYDFNSKKYYIVLDEVEIGMSEESIFGLLGYLDKNILSWLENTLGIMIITHSRIIAKHFVRNYDCDFYNIGYNSVDRDFNNWLYRAVKPVDFEWLKDWSNSLYKRVNERSRPLSTHN